MILFSDLFKNFLLFIRKFAPNDSFLEIYSKIFSLSPCMGPSSYRSDRLLTLVEDDEPPIIGCSSMEGRIL